MIINRVRPLSVGKIAAFLYGIIGLFIGAVIAVFALFGGLAAGDGRRRATTPRRRPPPSARSSASPASPRSSSRRCSTASWASSARSSWRSSTTSCRASSAGSRSTSPRLGQRARHARLRTAADRFTMDPHDLEVGCRRGSASVRGMRRADRPPTGPSEAADRARASRWWRRTRHSASANRSSSRLSSPARRRRPRARGPVVWRSSNEAVYVMWNGGLAVAHRTRAGRRSAPIADGRTVDTTLRVEPAAERHPAAAGPAHRLRVRRAAGRRDHRVSAPTSPLNLTDDDRRQRQLRRRRARRADLRGDRRRRSSPTSAVRVGGPAYRGDLLGNGGDVHLPIRRGDRRG